MKKLKPMSAERRAQIQSGFATATDLHWICPKCKTKLTGTLTQLKEGCPCGTASTRQGNTANTDAG